MVTNQLRHRRLFLYTMSAFLLWAAPTTLAAQTTPAALSVQRTTTRREVRKLGYGASLTLLGGPTGNVTVEGWNKNEIEIVADIELRAASEEDLKTLAGVTGFVLDEGFTSLKIVSTGPHDKDFIKRYAKGFPKRLIGTPWRIDYKLKVPAQVDIEINNGNGAVTLRGVEGALQVKTLDGDANLDLTGGAVVATVGRGTVNVNLLGHSWRGRGAAIQVAEGTLNVNLPPAFSGDIDASVLRKGTLENTYAALQPRERTVPSAKSLEARAGAGGALLTFVVGDGTLRLQSAPDK